MKNEQQIPWEKLPEGVRKFVKANWPFTDRENREIFANDIMEAIKPELDKAYDAGYDQADSYETESPRDFETWYKNTYLK
jgi:hypothetical protein